MVKVIKCQNKAIKSIKALSSPKRMSHLEMVIYGRLQRFGEPVREYKFHPTRKWRFDFAYPDILLAIEAEGGVYTHGRHTRSTGFINDTEKYNTASSMGWTILRYTSANINSITTDINEFWNMII